jgi:uncharacterized protein
MPSRWLPVVWGDFEPVWDSIADAQRVMELMMRHMNSIAGHLIAEPESFEPLFLEREVEGKTYTIVDEWCEGYRHGVELAEPEWRAGGERPASAAPLRRAQPRVGRNDPCPCGSGKKYKKCCLQ